MLEEEPARPIQDYQPVCPMEEEEPVRPIQEKQSSGRMYEAERIDTGDHRLKTALRVSPAGASSRIRLASTQPGQRLGFSAVVAEIPKRW